MTSSSFTNVLAIDTSSSELRLALSFDQDRSVQVRETVGRDHGRVIITKIRGLFDSSGLTTGDLHGIVACTGPGSFTGLRIGLAAAKGIAVATEIPIVGINLFEVAAHKLRAPGRATFIVIPLNRDECIIATVHDDSYRKDSVSVVRYDGLAEVIGDSPAVGLALDVSSRVGKVDPEKVSGQLDYDALDLLHLGVRRLAAGHADDIAELEPLYLQKSQAEIRFEQRQRHRRSQNRDPGDD
jgi:tRNA threonylcarbamoyladenosine biosynthesis protein TsaB